MKTFQPMLSQISGSPFIAPGITDQSKATLLKTLAPIAVDAYTGYNTAQLEGAIDFETEQYFDRNEQFDLGQQAKVEAEGLQMGIDSVWDAVDEQGFARADYDTVNTLVKGFDRKMETFTSAMKQGRMTPDQLYSRIIATTKEHVARNPFLQKQLLQHADAYLESSGLGGYLKQAMSAQEAQAKQQQDMDEAIIKRGITYGIDPLDPQAREKTLQLDRELTLWKRAEEQLKYVNSMLPEQAAEFLAGPGKDMKAGIWTVFLNQAAEISNRPDLQGNWPAQRQQIAFAAQRYVDSMIEAARSKNPRILEEQSVKDLFEEARNSVAAIRESVEQMNSLESMQEFMTRRRDIEASAQQLTAMRQVNRFMLQDFHLLAQALPGPVAERMKGKNVQYLDMGLNLLSGAFLQNPGVDNGVVLQDLVGAVVAGKNPQQQAKMIESLTKTFADNQSFNTPRDRVNGLAGVVRQIGGKDNMETLSRLTEEQRRDATKLIDDYKTAVEVSVNKELEALAEDGINLAWDMLPNGDMQLVYAPGSKQDPTKLATINKTFADHMTNFVRALSHLSGKTNYPETFKRLYGEVGKPAKTRLEQYQRMAEALNSAAKSGDTERASRLAQALAKMETDDKAFAPGADWDYPEATMNKMKGVSTSPYAPPEVSSRNIQEELPDERGFIDQGKAPAALPQSSPLLATTQRSRFMEAYKKGTTQERAVAALNLWNEQNQKKSPLHGKDPRVDAISSTSLGEAVLDALAEVHPAAGMAASAAIIAFGGVHAVPSLAKYMPKLLKEAGKPGDFKKGAVWHEGAKDSMGNVRPLNEGASRAVVASILEEEVRKNKARVQALHKEYWEQGHWMKSRVELPKTDLQWSQALADADHWVASRLNPTIGVMDK